MSDKPKISTLNELVDVLLDLIASHTEMPRPAEPPPDIFRMDVRKLTRMVDAHENYVSAPWEHTLGVYIDRQMAKRVGDVQPGTLIIALDQEFKAPVQVLAHELTHYTQDKAGQLSYFSPIYYLNEMEAQITDAAVMERLLDEYEVTPNVLDGLPPFEKAA